MFSLFSASGVARIIKGKSGQSNDNRQSTQYFDVGFAKRKVGNLSYLAVNLYGDEELVRPQCTASLVAENVILTFAACAFDHFSVEEDLYFIPGGMQDRDFSLALGLGLTYHHNDLKFEVSTADDVLGRYDGYEAQIEVSKVYSFGPFFVEPSVKLTYQDRHYVDYYYDGVMASEVNSDRPLYQGSGAVNKALGLA